MDNKATNGCRGYLAFETLFALRHFVQTASRLGAPFTTTLILCTFGFHLRRDRRWEWEMLFPNPGERPQTSHTELMTDERVPKQGF